MVNVTEERKLDINPYELSHYIRTTCILSARTTLELPNIASIRLFSEGEAQALAELVRKRNLFARHSWENNFYLQRIKALSNKTVIEVYRPGDPDQMIIEAQKAADLTEKIAFLCSVLTTPREKLHRLLAVDRLRGSEFDITVGRGFRYLRSKSRPERPIQGILIDERFSRRFERCGFPKLALSCLSQNDMAARVRSALSWLFESRQERVLPAALVKTSVALESLLILSGSEPLAQVLSERAAFILSSEAGVRQRVSLITKRFYDARSRVVHGSQKMAKKLIPNLVEGMDRLVLFLCLIIASNSHKWISSDSLREWCEFQRWGTPSTDIDIPFPKSYLSKAITLSLRA